MALKNYSIVVNDYSGTDRDGAVQALIDICGYIRSDAEEIIGDLPQEIVVELDGETAEKIAQALDAEGLDAEIYNENQYPVEYETKRSEGSGFWKVLGVALLAGLITRRHRRPPYYTRTIFGGWRRPRRRIEVRPAPRRVRGFGTRVYRREPDRMNRPMDNGRDFNMSPRSGMNRPDSNHNRPTGGMNRPSNNSRPSGGMNRPSGGMNHPGNNRGGMSGGPRGTMGGNRGGRGPGR